MITLSYDQEFDQTGIDRGKFYGYDASNCPAIQFSGTVLDETYSENDEYITKARAAANAFAKITITVNSSGNGSVTVTINNTSGNTITGNVCFAIYESTGTVYHNYVTAFSNSQALNLAPAASEEFTCSESSNGGNKVAVFVQDSGKDILQAVSTDY